MKTAVIYARYSSERQTEQSIEGQLHVCEDYAKRNNILILDTYIDRATTGTNDNRANFQRMLKDSSKRAWNYVLVYKLDRFSRNKYEMAMHRKTLRDNGIKILSAMENIPETPEGIILESLLEGMAEYYSAELSQKVRRGLRENRNKGNYTGGTLIYGYKVVDKKVVPDENEAPFVRFIYEEYAKGKRVLDISEEINRMGAMHKGRPIPLNSVHNILNNNKYSGRYEYNGEIFTNIYPQLVPDNIFYMVRDMQKSNRHGKASMKTPFLLRNKMICGYCGKVISSCAGTARAGDVKKYYRCTNHKSNSGCPKKLVRKDILEDFIVETTISLFSNDTMLDELAERLLVEQNNRLNDSTILNNLKAEQRQVNKQIENFLNAIGMGVVTMATKAKLEQLEQKLADIESELQVEESRERISLSKEEIKKFILTSIKKEPRQMINILIKRITLYDDKIEIEYNFTDRKNPDDNDHQGFIFAEYDSTIKMCTDHFNLTDCPMHVTAKI